MTTTQTASRGTATDGGGTVRAAVPPAPRRRRRRGSWTAWAFLAPVVIYLVVFYAWPLYRNVELSVRDYTVRSFVMGDAPFVGLDNYIKVLQDPTFGPAFWHTAVFTLVSIAFQFTIGLALAVFFHQNFRLSATLRALFLVPWLLPLIVSASTWSWMLNSDSGVVNAALEAFGLPGINWLTSPDWALTSVIIANIWIGIPFNLVILYSGLQNIPQELYEAASIDGANGWQRFWRVTFPLLRPVSAITLLLGLIYTLKVFDIIWIMTRGGPGTASTTFATWSYQLGFASTLPDFSPAAAVGNLLIILALVFGFVYIRTQRKQDLA
ncbi:multiple sugar transport system permease protein [Leifsonia sp. 98AMF]|uniref:carbohydrate ABC transporter permease n=1 Tax=unclassified Leifsonia TaxID=2663824 RepID=UPI00087A3FD6|nr:MULTISPECIES: sugar ABC transporter permease [unclassified Leifsonia]SDH09192.1 multiple sugar transport system permease protein [Leifsonia sp. 197AMF]SDJ30258.1 multiple sugar transport system permease protein [Leifsonia sp. 466MF]SDK50049.1 multiple sugar transport system permease protein [Leifsonia sp. 157MF]SDN51946.1 multiple sugar transport system permease protein [Leifsonia sp. 509MF]SEN58235.1 multiple sugar transport system permease protein [Leifsonia sp. 467MF]